MEDALGPPKATVNAMIKELAEGLKFANNYSELVMEISQEFIAQLAAEANKICLGDGKKTIAPDHVFRALKALKMDDMLDNLNDSHEAFLKETETRNKAKNEQAEDLESLEEYQRQLFEASRTFSMSRAASESKNISRNILSKLATGNINPTPMPENTVPLNKTISEVTKPPQFREEEQDDYENF